MVVVVVVIATWFCLYQDLKRLESENSCPWLGQFNYNARGHILSFSEFLDSTVDKTGQGHEKLQVTQNIWDICLFICLSVLVKS